MENLGIVIIIIILILCLILFTPLSEKLTNNGGTAKVILYGADNIYHSIITDKNRKAVIRIDLRSATIDTRGTKFKVTLWNIYNGENTASSESGMYNIYDDDAIMYKANPAKYQFIGEVGPGKTKNITVLSPVKKVFVVIESA